MSNCCGSGGDGVKPSMGAVDPCYSANPGFESRSNYKPVEISAKYLASPMYSGSYSGGYK